MPQDIRVPAVGESVSEGVLARWLVADGDYVAMDQALYELETDKISTEVPAPVAGKVTHKAAEGDTVAIDQVVAEIDESQGGGDDYQPSEDSKAPTKNLEPAPAAEPAAKQITHSHESAGISPAVKQLLADNNLRASEIRGTGPKGRITKGDVLDHLKQSPTAKPAAQSPSEDTADVGKQGEADRPTASGEDRRRMSPLRQRIAKRLVQAQRTAAMLTTFNEVDMSACMALRKQHKEAFQEKHGVGLGFMSFFVSAAVAALRTYPDINSRIEGDEIVTPHDINVGVAVGTEKGLVVPVLRQAQNMGFADIEGGIRGYAKRAREGKLAIADMDGGTFTITNGGVYGSLMSTPILNPPQSGILGMHTIKERAVAIDGQVVVRPMMYIALSYDHRIVDGSEAVGFLVTIKNCIEAPERLLLGI
ncbi:MAG: 2-oxoglutarate dehydrogenase complex dihydrolipoyllysine-residue succinyltransferase [Planctomycetota bacterium]|nr:MAG: 2-oxoglutarate dehydrogenase complex dihydrolipoyllysine-residue succinyltransferase [Planctomycetota bacterium]